MAIISHICTIIVSLETEAGADKAMQIHSGTLMKLKLQREASVEISLCMAVHYGLTH